MCTLRNFPSEIEHCIEWGRAQFTDLFASSAQEAVNFTRDPDAWVKELRKKTVDADLSKGKMASVIAKEKGPTQAVLTLARMAVASDSENSFDRCVSDAFVLFHKMFRDKVVSLITSYPENSVDSQGRPFWSGTKRFPRAVDEFNIDDESHLGYLMSTANLLAVNRGLRAPDDPIPADDPWRSKAYFVQRLKSMHAPPLVVESVDMSGGGEEEEEKRKSLMTAEQKQREEEEKDAKLVKDFTDILEELEKIGTQLQKGTARSIESAEFEKDQDWNFHIDFVTSSSNLRAWNYRLKQAPRHQVKMIAGKIIPALATTTAAVCGLVMIEMLKIVQDKPLEAFKDSSNSLGINGYFFSEPLPPSKAKDEYDPIEMSQVVCYPSGFSKWNKIRVKCASSDPTLKDFIEAFSQATEGLVLTSLAHPNSNVDGAKGKGLFIYERDAWQAEMKAKYAEWMDKSLKQLVQEIHGEEVLAGENRKFLIFETGQEDKEGNTVRVSRVVWMF
jgi:ubiquitin-activating enzyme E1